MTHEPRIVEIPAPLYVETWYPDTEKENHLVCSGFSHGTESNLKHFRFVEEVERPDKRGLTAEGFDDWERELIDFTTPYWEDIKWYIGYAANRWPTSWMRDENGELLDEFEMKWRKVVLSVRYSTEYPIQYPI